MDKRNLFYRGFMLMVSKRPGLGWCVRYESTNGEVVRQAFELETEREAIQHAERKIDAMIAREDKQQERLRPEGGRKR